MSMLNVISIGFIGVGVVFNSYASNTNQEIKKKISNEKVYLFPSQMHLIKEPNSIVQVENNLLNKFRNNRIGYISMNKIVKNPTIVHKYVYNAIIDKYEIQKYIEYEEVKKSIGSQILFPNFHKKLILDPELLFGKKIKIIINNTNYIKSNSSINLIANYENIVKANIPNFKPDIILDNLHNTHSLELETNLLPDYSNLYFMVNYKNDKYIITTMSDSENLIIKEKYINDIHYANGLNIISISLVGFGIIFGITGLLTKN